MAGVRISLSRRQMLHLAGGSFAAGLLPRVAPAQSSVLRVHDAHAHLFNLTDLPLSGFIKYVLLPVWAQSLPIIGIALGGLAQAAGRISVTIDDEGDGVDWEALDRGRSARFAEQTSRRIAQGTEVGAAARVAGVLRLARTAAPRFAVNAQESYLALALALQSSENAEGVDAARTLLESPQSSSAYDRVINIEPATISRVLDGNWNPRETARIGALAPLQVRRLFSASPAAPPSAAGRCPDEPITPPNGSFGERARASLDCIKTMGASRHGHVDRYLERMRSGGRAPDLLVNLLVDYDRWLKDEPSPGSTHAKQIHFWSRMATAQAGRVDIRTFAGFDPLRHAEDRLKGSTAYWDGLQRHFMNSKSADRTQTTIWGFKLYPPMGFRPSGNAAADFAGNDPALRNIRRRWNDAPALRGKAIHEELNRSLQTFFDFCTVQGAPVLAHGRHSNDAGHCWGSRADPAGWGAVVTAHPKLHLCLGHFAEAGDFLGGMADEAGNRRPHSRVWALHGLRDLLRLNRENGANVYADVGYMSEFLIGSPAQGAALSADFFSRLGEYCAANDERCEHLMFGSDWIMLDREVHHERYLDTIVLGMRRAGWHQEWQDNFFHRNLRRFLGLA